VLATSSIMSDDPARRSVFRAARTAAAALALLATLVPAPTASLAASPAAQDERAEAESRLATARSEKDAAADALEALVADLKDDYALLTDDVGAPARRQALVLAMVDALEPARTRLAAEVATGKALLRGRKRQLLAESFMGPVEQAATVDRRLCGWVARQVADALSHRESLDGLDSKQMQALVDGLFPKGRSWYVFWNESFHHDLPEAAAWEKALLAYEAAGVALDRIAQPERYGSKGEIAPPGMVIVPGGSYELGPNTGWERPERRVTLKLFAIDRREVTNAEYALYVDSLQAERRAEALPRGWLIGEDGAAEYDLQRRDHPVIWVDWNQAAAYAAWAGKRLPTEDEWEAAAAGTQGFSYPWGHDWRTGMANAEEDAGGTLPVESFPQARSPAGCVDLAGNAWEWTATLEDGSNIKTLPDGLFNAIIRGGGWESRREELGTRYRRGALAHDTFAPSRYKVPIGFRCVKDF
jgi:formylglycine-generating enzyme required for sulfatase activity